MAIHFGDMSKNKSSRNIFLKIRYFFYQETQNLLEMFEKNKQQNILNSFLF